MSLNEWWLVGAIRLSSPKKQTVHSKRIKNIVFQTRFWRNQAKNHYESLWITIISDVCFSCNGWICSMLFLWVADMLKFFSSHCSCSFSRNRMVLQYLEVGSSTFLMLDSFALDCRLSWFSDSNSLSLNQKKMHINILPSDSLPNDSWWFFRGLAHGAGESSFRISLAAALSGTCREPGGVVPWQSRGPVVFLVGWWFHCQIAMNFI